MINTNSKIAILGYGLEGKSMTEYLLKKNFPYITICDKRSFIDNLSPLVNTCLGDKYLDNLERFDIIFRSPGIPYITPNILKNKEKLTSQTKYFLKNSKGVSIGVTGTKGKGTTTTLIHKILLASGRDSYIGGNIGEPPINFIDSLTNDSVSVLELSSFQLQDSDISPNISVILNITPEHLDYHTNLSEYIQAKKNIVKHQTENDIVIVNDDYETPIKLIENTKSKVYKLSTQYEVEQGAFVINNKIFIKIDNTEDYLMDTNEVGLLGPHNIENILAAVCVTKIMGCSIESIRDTVSQFKGLPHRLEYIRTINNIDYYNDSFSTTPETAIAAIKSFDKGRLVILLGGSEKYSDYSELGKQITEALVIPICYGKTGTRIRDSIISSNKNYPVYVTKTLEDAFEISHKKVKPGDSVILSPASASFDLFANYKERGARFIELVKNLNHDIKFTQIQTNENNLFD